MQDAEAERRRKRHAEGDHHARARDRGEPEFDVAQLLEILDRIAIANVPRDWRKEHRAHHGNALIAALRTDPVEALEGELKVVAHAPIEDRQRALARLRTQDVAAAGNPYQSCRHGVGDTAAVSLRHRNAIGARDRRRIGRQFLHGAAAEHHAHIIGLFIGDDVRGVGRRHELPAGNGVETSRRKRAWPRIFGGSAAAGMS